MSGQEGSVAPKERINVTFKPSAGEGLEDLELPLKLMMIGDYTLTEDDRKLEDRKAININKNNFNEVLEKHDLNLDLQVANKLSDEASDEELALSLQFKSMKDFDPASLVQQVPEMKALMELPSVKPLKTCSQIRIPETKCWPSSVWIKNNKIRYGI